MRSWQLAQFFTIIKTAKLRESFWLFTRSEGQSFTYVVSTVF